jgi:hypothetical protein
LFVDKHENEAENEVYNTLDLDDVSENTDDMRAGNNSPVHGNQADASPPSSNCCYVVSSPEKKSRKKFD